MSVFFRFMPIFFDHFLVFSVFFSIFSNADFGNSRGDRKNWHKSEKIGQIGLKDTPKQVFLENWPINIRL